MRGGEMAQDRQPIKAHVRVEYDDGSVYSMDMETIPAQSIKGCFEVNSEPIEREPSAGGWRQYRPGMPIGYVELTGWACAVNVTKGPVQT